MHLSSSSSIAYVGVVLFKVGHGFTQGISGYFALHVGCFCVCVCLLPDTDLGYILLTNCLD